LKGDGATTWAEAKRAMKRKFEKDEDDWLHILEKTNGRKGCRTICNKDSAYV